MTKYCKCEFPEIVIYYGEVITSDVRRNEDGRLYYAKHYRGLPDKPRCDKCGLYISPEMTERIGL